MTLITLSKGLSVFLFSTTMKDLFIYKYRMNYVTNTFNTNKQYTETAIHSNMVDINTLLFISFVSSQIYLLRSEINSTK